MHFEFRPYIVLFLTLFIAHFVYKFNLKETPTNVLRVQKTNPTIRKKTERFLNKIAYENSLIQKEQVYNLYQVYRTHKLS